MQRYFAINKDNDKLILKESDIHHIKKVMRMNIKDKIEVIYDKVNYLCEIENLDSFNIKILKIKDENNEMDLDITIAIGLVKEQKMDLILQKLTELGVNKIIPLNIVRCFDIGDTKYLDILDKIRDDNTNDSIFVYLFTLVLATSPPSFIIFSSEGIIIPSNCITIDAVMYGVIDIAKIDSLEKAPPDIVSTKLAKLAVDDFICSAIANESTPGTTI